MIFQKIVHFDKSLKNLNIFLLWFKHRYFSCIPSYRREVSLAKLKFMGNCENRPKSAFLHIKNLFWTILAKCDGCPQILFLLIKLQYYRKVSTKNIDFLTAANAVMIFQKYLAFLPKLANFQNFSKKFFRHLKYPL